MQVGPAALRPPQRWAKRLHHHLGWVIFAIFAFNGVSACVKEETTRGLSYTADAKRAYDEAFTEFQSHNWLEAQNLFREVKRKYAYSKFARLAELRIADADFEQEKFAEAIRGYRQFVHDHRSDVEEVAYARAKVAEAQYREINDSFLLPASEERDQAAVVDSYRELRAYLGDYPDAKESAHVRELLEDVTARLIRHEISVARYYLRRDNFQAAVSRIQYALRNYANLGDSALTASSGGAVAAQDAGPPRARARSRAPKAAQASADGLGIVSGVEAEALLLLGETYLKMDRRADAEEAFRLLLAHYPTSGLSVQAERYLTMMRERGWIVTQTAAPGP